MHRLRPRALASLPLALLLLAVSTPAAHANHSWNGYHWARTANPFRLTIGDNVSAKWDPYLATTAKDWSKSAVLDMQVGAGRSSPSRCPPTTGRVEVCNSTYGKTGWLGFGKVWVSGKHITKGTVKLNDTYFGTATYDVPAWRNLVTCQEVGHTIGLAHQDEKLDNPNLGTCMDYTNLPASNQHPNQHDYAELADVYRHLDTTTTVGKAAPSSAAVSSAAVSSAAVSSAADLSGEPDLGRAVRSRPDGRPVLFERDLGGSERVFTWVTWAG